MINITNTLKQVATTFCTKCVQNVNEEEIIYLSLHCHHQNDSCIKMGMQ